ncbi:MAG: LamG domain-containing protein [archaeon]
MWSTNARSFDGLNDYVRVNNFGGLDNNFTMSAWVKLAGSPLIYGHSIIGTDGWSANGDLSFGVDTQSGQNLLYGYIYNSSPPNPVSSSNLSLNNWYYVTWVHQNSQDKFYINGSLDTIYNFSPYPTIFMSSHDLLIGSWFVNSAYRPLKGSLDEVAIWDRALSETEVRNLFSKGLTSLNVKYRACDQNVDNDCSGADNVSDWSGANISPNTGIDLSSALNDNGYQYFQFLASFGYSDIFGGNWVNGFGGNWGNATIPVLKDLNFIYKN